MACFCQHCLFTLLLELKLRALYLGNGQSDKVSNVLSQSINGQMDDTLIKWLNAPESVSEGVPMLNNVLLKVSNIKLAKEINDIQSRGVNLKEKNSNLRNKLQVMNIQLRGERSRISQLPIDINNGYVNKIEKIHTSIETLVALTLPNQTKLLQKYQVGAIKELFDFWGVHLQDDLMIILFTPIIPIENMPHYPIEFIRTSVGNMCMFVNTLSGILGVDLPFNVDKTSSGFLVVESVKFLDTDQQSFTDVSKREIIEVAWCLAKVCLNVVELVVRLGLTKRWKLTLGDVSSPGKLLAILYDKYHIKAPAFVETPAVDVSRWQFEVEDSFDDGREIPKSAGSGDMTTPVGTMDSKNLALYIVRLLEMTDPSLMGSLGVLVEASGIC